MKIATARKSFTHTATGRRLRTGDEVPPTDPHVMGELKANGLVGDVRDAPVETSKRAEEDLHRDAMTNAVLEEGDGPRVVISFRDKAEAGFFRKIFVEGQTAMTDRAKERPAPAPRQTKPDAKPRQTKPAPNPTTGDAPEPAAAALGAGGEPGASAGDGNQSEPEGEFFVLGEGRRVGLEGVIGFLIANPPTGGVTTREAFDNLSDDAKGEVVSAALPEIKGLTDEEFAKAFPAAPAEAPAATDAEKPVETPAAPPAGRRPRGNKPAA